MAQPLAPAGFRACTQSAARMNRNHDPKDDRELRPQVGFRLKAGAYDPSAFSAAVGQRGLTYHDLFLLKAVDGEVPGTIRFPWDTPRLVVDATAQWLQSLLCGLGAPELWGSGARCLTRA
jgi:hypothetical protein